MGPKRLKSVIRLTEKSQKCIKSFKNNSNKLDSFKSCFESLKRNQMSEIRLKYFKSIKTTLTSLPRDNKMFNNSKDVSKFLNEISNV